jgi:hypothetical protein
MCAGAARLPKPGRQISRGVANIHNREVPPLQNGVTPVVTGAGGAGRIGEAVTTTSLQCAQISRTQSMYSEDEDTPQARRDDYVFGVVAAWW